MSDIQTPASPEAIKAALATLAQIEPLAKQLIDAELAGRGIADHHLQHWRITGGDIEYTTRRCSCHSDAETYTISGETLYDAEERQRFLDGWRRMAKTLAREAAEQAEARRQAANTQDRQTYERLKERFG